MEYSRRRHPYICFYLVCCQNQSAVPFRRRYPCLVFFPTVFLIVPFKLYLTQSVNGNRSYSINFSDVQFLIWEKFLWSPPVLIHYEIWGLRSVSTAGWKKTTQHSGQRTREKRYNWVTEGRLGANILINIGLSSSLSPSLSLSTFKLSTQLEV